MQGKLGREKVCLRVIPGHGHTLAGAIAKTGLAVCHTDSNNQNSLIKTSSLLGPVAKNYVVIYTRVVHNQGIKV